MDTVKTILDSLSNTPRILENLLSAIPEKRYRKKRLPGKWCIHEQVCHLVESQWILIDRFRLFEKSENPYILNYDPASDDDKEKYMQMRMKDSLFRFPGVRKDMINMLTQHPPSFWDKTGKHESFEPYGTRILLMHCLNVDYAHLFSIEQLGLTKPGMEDGIMVLP